MILHVALLLSDVSKENGKDTSSLEWKMGRARVRTSIAPQPPLKEHSLHATMTRHTGGGHKKARERLVIRRGIHVSVS